MKPTPVKEGTTILMAGDVHGNWNLLARQIELVIAQYGQCDGVICVGDVEALRSEEELIGVTGPSKYRVLGSFPLVLRGSLRLRAPVWFIGGNHEPWPALDKQGPGEWAPGVTFLGRAGVSVVLGLRVAFLSGIYGQGTSEGLATARRSPRERSHWVQAEVEKLLKTGNDSRVDLLVTHEWPAGIGVGKNGGPAGSEAITELDRRLRPQLHVCGHMHRRLSRTIGETKVEALGHIMQGGEGSCVTRWSQDGVVVLDPLPIRPQSWR